MCRPVNCQTCNRTTWAGCGQHVADVKAIVPTDQWCAGHDASDVESWVRRITGTRRRSG